MTWSRPCRAGARGIRVGGGIRTVHVAAVVACGGVLSLSACGVLPSASAPTTSPTSAVLAPTPSGSPTVATASPTTDPATTPTTAASTSAPTNVATLTGGNGSALGLVLPASGLPAGWGDTEPRDTGGYRMSVCGVDLEPSSPVDGAQKRWQASANGPFVEEHVRVYTDYTARDVLAALKKAIPGCRTYQATDAQGGSSTYQVSQLALRDVGSRTVAWRQRVSVPVPAAAAPSTGATSAAPKTATPSGGATSTTATPSTAVTAAPAPVVVQDVAVTVRGTSIVLIASYAVNATPQADVLARAVKAIPGR